MRLPPRRDAKSWQQGNSEGEPWQRDENLRAIGRLGRKRWKKASGYQRPSLAETAAVLRELRRLRPGWWQKVIQQGHSGEVHYFEHSPGMSLESNSSFHGKFMSQQPSSRIFLSAVKGTIARQQELFALLNLGLIQGLIQSLASVAITPTEAVERFYHAQNCPYVQKHFRQKPAHTIMSHGSSYQTSSTTAILSSFNNAVRRGGIRSAGKDRFSGTSIETTTKPLASISCAMWLSKTVFPTPRKPTNNKLLATVLP